MITRDIHGTFGRCLFFCRTINAMPYLSFMIASCSTGEEDKTIHSSYILLYYCWFSAGLHAQHKVLHRWPWKDIFFICLQQEQPITIYF